MNLVTILNQRKIKQIAAENKYLLFDAAIKNDLSALNKYRQALRSNGAEYVKINIHKQDRLIYVSFKAENILYNPVFYWNKFRPSDITLKEWRQNKC